ncbi:MAG: hypothetical protein HQK77_05980 [Desulfobacterales bacterium]|nr:hypothetical protein [Desulfobacterales bacterium]
MRRWIISHESGQTATLEYEENKRTEPAEFVLTCESESIKNKLLDYFNKEREYQIPVSQKIDDYRIDVSKPTKNTMYLELALCTLCATLEEFVDFSADF